MYAIKDSHNIEIVFIYSDQEKIQNRKKADRERIRNYYIKQKLSGLVMTAIGIVAPFLLEGDATISLIALPLGIFLIFTKEKVMMF